MWKVVLGTRSSADAVQLVHVQWELVSVDPIILKHDLNTKCNSFEQLFQLIVKDNSVSSSFVKRRKKKTLGETRLLWGNITKAAHIDISNLSFSHKESILIVGLTINPKTLHFRACVNMHSMQNIMLWWYRAADVPTHPHREEERWVWCSPTYSRTSSPSQSVCVLVSPNWSRTQK